MDQTKTWSLDAIKNIGHALTETAKRMPTAIAVACPKKGQPKEIASGATYDYDTISFADLEEQSNRIALGLSQMGIGPGKRIALMVPPGIEFVKHVFALFKTGAVIILIDPGMGKHNMIECLSDASPQGMVGIPKAHLARVLFRKKFPKCKLNVVVGGVFPKCRRSKAFTQKLAGSNFEEVPLTREDEAAIIFTTGSTGPPKGVLYRHRIFIEQCEQIRDYFSVQPGGADVSGFPLFALFNTAMGTTTIFPEMDPTRPANVFPPNIIDAAAQFKANQSFGSPALWNTVSKYCQQHQLTLPTIKRVLTAGAPVPPDVLTRVKKIIANDGDVFTPYGATESLPIACNSASEVIAETAAKTASGAGTCVGKKFDRINWRLIRISDEPIQTMANVKDVAHGEIGELIVSGPVVTDKYVTRVKANAEHKIQDGDSFWHRMGDLGYFDDQNRFWFCGRKSHRVLTTNGPMFTITCEGIINTHPKIYRSALVGIVGAGEAGTQIPVIILEPLKEHFPSDHNARETLIAEVKQIASQHWQTDSIQHFLIHQALPVDIRHNSKIFREQLRSWAKERI
jgi:acyl-CoA synthetase (AMP-forming)/AMP-acid ligase II